MSSTFVLFFASIFSAKHLVQSVAIARDESNGEKGRDGSEMERLGHVLFAQLSASLRTDMDIGPTFKGSTDQSF